MVNPIDYICEITKSCFRNRKIVIYGYTARARIVKAELKKRGLTAAFFVDRSIYQSKKMDVFNPAVLKGRASEFYVIIPMLHHLDIVEILKDFGYSAKDYTYLGGT